MAVVESYAPGSEGYRGGGAVLGEGLLYKRLYPRVNKYEVTMRARHCARALTIFGKGIPV